MHINKNFGFVLGAYTNGYNRDTKVLVRSLLMRDRSILLDSTTFAVASAIATSNPVQVAQAQQQPAAPSGKKPNILVIFGDDIGQRATLSPSRTAVRFRPLTR
jgi:hypothetical protein